MSQDQRIPIAALSVFIILQVIMLSSLYAGIPPHPPVRTPFFGIAPFIGASVSVALAAILVGPTQSLTGRLLSGLTAVMALVSFGPQKYFDAQFHLIWPAVLTGQVAALAIVHAIAKAAGLGAAPRGSALCETPAQ